MLPPPAIDESDGLDCKKYHAASGKTSKLGNRQVQHRRAVDAPITPDDYRGHLYQEPQ
jgi:hypothetical protein